MKDVKNLDPIMLEIMWNRLISIAEEQAKTLIRASFSTVVGEMEDLACALYDSRGRIISQAATGTQGVLIGMMKGMQAVLARFPIETHAPGDVIIGNDPWLFSGHKYDITVATPVFLDSRPVGMVACILHGSDIGGISSPGESTDVVEEGLEIPIMKLFKKGELNRELLDLYQANVRIPEQVTGDLMAQVSANEVASRKLQEFMREQGLESLDALSDAIIERTSRVFKQEIGKLPDGTYRNEVGLDGMEHPMKVVATVHIKGEDLTFDFEGSSPQTTQGGINSVYNFTFAYTCHALKSILVPDLPNNEGLFNSFKLKAPEASLINASYPAPVMARYVMVPFISAAAIGAITKACPERAIADSAGGTMTLVTRGGNPDERFVYWLVGWGGMGARASKDGLSATSYPANVANVSVEIIENVSPLFVTERELVIDSGGPGKFRGGLDQRVTLMARGGNEHSYVNCLFQRIKHPAAGCQGGMDGAPGDFDINHKIHPSPKAKYKLQPEDFFSFCQGGGGGMGRPQDRDEEMVLNDVVNEYVSLESARKHYLVAIDPEKLLIDWDETRGLRDVSYVEALTKEGLGNKKSLSTV